MVTVAVDVVPFTVVVVFAPLTVQTPGVPEIVGAVLAVVVAVTWNEVL
jgi:hypothetical protein